MKPIYCAECGKQLDTTIKAIKLQNRIVRLVAPHTCGEPNPEFNFENLQPPEIKPKKKLDELFNSFKTVQKINDLLPTKEAKDLMGAPQSGDLRNDKPVDLRESKTSAPMGVTDQVKGLRGEELNE